MQSNGLLVSLPQFWKVVHILASIPVTSSLAERSFSCLRRLKTYLKNTMKEERVSSLAVINIKRHFANKEDINTVINIFGKLHGRSKYVFSVQFHYISTYLYEQDRQDFANHILLTK